MASSKPFRIEPASSSQGGVMFLPRTLIKELGISSGKYTLAFGAKKASVQIKEGREQEGVRLDPELIRTLCLPPGKSLPLIRAGELLRFGYVLGILANVKTTAEGQVSGVQEPVFRNLLEAAKKAQMYGYVFAVQDLDWEDLCATGYCLVKGRWVKRRVPIPDAVYEQIISRRYLNRADVAPERERLYHLLSPRFFNPGYFDKWQVHQWLAGDSRTSSYLPDAICFQSVEQAANFLYQHADVYMKPVHGSLGIGIIRTRRKRDGRVFYQIKKKDGSLRQEYTGSTTTFLKKFERRLLKGPYLIQKALSLKSWQGRPFDIRILLQKDSTGKWNRTKAFCRIAQEGQITSNLSTGGDALAVKQVLQEMFDEKGVRKVMRQLREIAEAVPLVIEVNNTGTIGELGLDLGLDENGHIWVIEVNAKPWKKPGTEEGEWRDLTLLAFQRPVQFAKYLCEVVRDR